MKPDTSLTEPFLLDTRSNIVHRIRGLRPECNAKEIPQANIKRLTPEGLLALAEEYILCQWCHGR